MNKLGVIQIIDSLDAGGAEVLAVNIVNSLAEKEINSHLCVTRKEGILKNNITNTKNYLFLKKKKSFEFSSLIRLRNYIKSNNISIIHAHSTSYFLAFCIKLLNTKLKIIWHDHYGKSEELNIRKKFPLNFISFFFNAIISVNTNLQNWAIEELHCKNVFFLNNFPLFHTYKKTTLLKGVDNKRIVHLAAFREQKNHKFLIDAFKDFSSTNNDWTLHLVGNIPNNSYSNKILSLIKKEKLNNKIFIYGACLDIEYILKQATIGVLSSNSEGLPISLLEYGLAKLPVVVTDVGECGKVVVNSESGWVINPNDCLNFSKALTTLANSTNLREKFSNNHYNNVIKEFSKEKFISELLKIYNL